MDELLGAIRDLRRQCSEDNRASQQSREDDPGSALDRAFTEIAEEMCVTKMEELEDWKIDLCQHVLGPY